MSAVVVSTRLRARSGALDALQVLAKELVALCRANPACVTASAAADLEEPSAVLLLEEWDSPAALAAHLQTCGMQRVTARLRELTSANEVRQYATLLADDLH
eukprot:TRINITY_DN10531_c0_g1_i1.p1 TRINITY_DN10531_c0_g1~~TRINITY_DN10531_c0_g1_i1.p1  ORF type:complete len:102 (+),score=21.80 TRINITY_DN10531_c0_g1_i1:82-387(+)